MKLRRLGCFLVFFVFPLLVGMILVHIPRARFAQKSQAVLEERQKSWQELLQQYPPEGGKNAFMDPTFKCLWSQDPHVDRRALEIINQWNLCNYALHPGAVTGNFPDMVSIYNLLAFEGLLPALHDFSNKAVWYRPSAKLGPVHLSDSRAVGELCTAMLAYSDFLGHRGQTDQAMGILAELIDISDLFGRSPTSSAAFIQSQALRVKADIAMIGLLRQPEHLTRAALQSTLTRLKARSIPPERLEQAFESDVLAFHNSLEEVDSLMALMGTPQAVHPRLRFRVLRALGLVDREARLFDNDAFSALGGAAIVGKPAPFDWTDDLLGRHSPVGYELLWTYRRASRRLHKVRTTTAATELVVALQLFRKIHGAYPKTLKDLKSLGFETLPVNELSSEGHFGYSLEGGRPTLTVPMDPEWDELFGKLEHKVYNIDARGLHFLG